jgi:preprotein translocase subunit SecE
VDNNYISIGIWVGVIAAVFAVLWFSGNLAKLRNYVLETREELRKCTWPTVSELKGSTVLVMIAVAFLGLFTVCVDYVLVIVVKQMVSL